MGRISSVPMVFRSIPASMDEVDTVGSSLWNTDALPWNMAAASAGAVAALAKSTCEISHRMGAFSFWITVAPRPNSWQ